MGESKAERIHQRQRTEAKRQIARKQAGEPSGVITAPGYGFTAHAEGVGDALWELVASGEFRSFVVRPDGHGGATWTVKAVLKVSARSVGVYMHGEVKNESDIPGVVRYCLAKGDWRTDKYYSG